MVVPLSAAHRTFVRWWSPKTNRNYYYNWGDPLTRSRRCVDAVSAKKKKTKSGELELNEKRLDGKFQVAKRMEDNCHEFGLSKAGAHDNSMSDCLTLEQKIVRTSAESHFACNCHSLVFVHFHTCLELFISFYRNEPKRNTWKKLCSFISFIDCLTTLSLTRSFAIADMPWRKTNRNYYSNWDDHTHTHDPFTKKTDFKHHTLAMETRLRMREEAARRRRRKEYDS